MTSTPNPPSPSSRTRIAIIGGGIAGLCCTLGLLKYPYIDVHIYEAAPTFSEFGAGVEIGPNAQTALKLISPLAEKAFTETTTPNLWPSHEKIFCDYIMGVGEHEGQLLCAQKCETGMQSMHRARFLSKLVEGIPKHVTHLNKRLAKIEDRNSGGVKEDNDSGGVLLHFTDSTTALFDAVIGAEGIRSVVREHILGKELAEPVFSNSVVFRNIREMEVVREKLGREYAGKASILCGPKRGILSDRIENGTMANLAALIFEVDSWPHSTFHVPAKREELDVLFEGWGEKTKALIELMDTPSLTKWAIYTHPITPTYISLPTSPSPSSTSHHPCALIGDAAHAQSPFQGTGAGQAIEDALILSHVLGLINFPAQIQIPIATQITAAFQAYDAVRRPRGDRAVRTSVEAGDLIGFKESKVEEVGGVEGVGRELSERMEWLWGADIESMVHEVEKKFREALGEEGM